MEPRELVGRERNSLHSLASRVLVAPAMISSIRIHVLSLSGADDLWALRDPDTQITKGTDIHVHKVPTSVVHIREDGSTGRWSFLCRQCG